MDADLEDADSHEGEVHEWAVRRDRFYNDGYRDALDQGKTATVQEGFDTGFQEGVVLGTDWGFLRGALTSLLAFPQSLATAQLQEVKDLQARVAAFGADAAALACAAAAEQRGVPQRALAQKGQHER
ncbi:hypothetical protein WJX81_007581 [Elliptochloris bilobata]|uniref:Essential protein Yae1 N-terminal domain-containing protein n=1 Tax=Elliptochloris bilobata TaxID=381761 RepID=A0AAW1QI49_9CHLO